MKQKTLVVGLLLTFLLSWLSSNVYADDPLSNTILSIVASEQNINQSRLQIGTIETKTFPLSNVTLYQAKVVDTTTGEVYSVVVDETGTQQDANSIRNAETVAYQARYGSLDPALYERLQTMADDERLMVAIWLRADIVVSERPDFGHKPAEVETGEAELPPPADHPHVPPEALQEKTRQEIGIMETEVAAIRAQQAQQRQAIETARQSAADHLAAQMTILQQPLLTTLTAEGFTPAHVSTTSPLIYVELPKSAILGLAQHADVDTIYGPNENFAEMSSAKPTQKANAVNTWGFNGSGVDVAILEGERIQFDNQWLNVGTTRVATGTVDVAGGHATKVAGVVASQHPTHQGVAQGVNLFSANSTDGSDPSLSSTMDWAAITQNVDVINNSWFSEDNLDNTDLNDHDRHLDYIVRNLWSTVVKSAGNQAGGVSCGFIFGGTGYVTSPGRGYNVITVGNYEDHETLTWDDDTMNECSSFVNPSTGIEKPEVAAVGSSINTTIHEAPWIGDVGGGTSFAAPMVAGEAALLMDRDSNLQILPEAVKAIIMATALHNIEGDPRLSDQDGAGGVDMRAAFRVVDEGWWDRREVNSSSFPYTYTVYAYSGEVVRVAIAWDSNPAADYSTDPLEADIDLAVYAPSGGFVTGSFSSNNSYEIVEFTASETGDYELRIHASRFDGITESVGAAWWPGHRVLTSHMPQTLDTPPIARDYYHFNAGTSWNAVGIRPPTDSDYDIYLYTNSAFGDPADYILLEDSILGGSAVDFVVVDRNHAPAERYYSEVGRISGSGGNYPIEWSPHTGNIFEPGMYGPFTMSADSVVRVWAIAFGTNQAREVVIRPTAGTANLGAALFDSDPNNSASFYQGRSQAIATADANGVGLSETLVYTNSGPADSMGLVVYNNNSTSATFYLDVDLSSADVYLLVDLSASFEDDLPVFKAQAPGIISTVRASNPTTRFGLGKFEDYPINPFGSAALGDKAYEQLVDLTFDTNLVLSTISGLFTHGGFDGPESQLPALYQAATGKGQDLSAAGYPGASIPSDQQANFRDEATKIFLLWTDAPFHRPGDPGDIPYPGPSFSETVDAILALPDDSPKVVGIFSSESTGLSTDQGTQGQSLETEGTSPLADGLSDLKAIAAATGALAPAGGVDCNNDGTIDIAPGEPLVCTIASTGEGIGEAIIALVETATKPIIYLYLPVILKNFDESIPPPPILKGTVTDNGIPVIGTELLLRYNDGSTWSTYATTTTDASGNYQFSGLPNLGSDQELYVLWLNNNADPEQLSSWSCSIISASTTDPSAYQCSFDVDNIDLLSPDSSVSVSLPQTFSWSKRPITTDDYELNLIDISDFDPWWWTDPSLGYADNYTLNSLSSGFLPGEQYGWFMGVRGENGVGFSYNYHVITFSPTGISQVEALPLPARRAQEHIEMIALPQSR